MAIAVTLLVVFVIVGGAIAAGVSSAKQNRASKLRTIADYLGGGGHDSNQAWGTKLGPKLTVELAMRGAGSSAESWTHIHVDVPPAYPLAVHVRRHARSDRRKVERGEMVDVVLGDPEFDEAYLVEAAPADVVRELLGAELRALLASYSDADLDTLQRPDGTRAITLGISGWKDEVEALRQPLAVMAKLGASVRDAYARADSAVVQGTTGDPYRPVADAQPAAAAQASREAEVRQIGEIRAKRAADAKMIVTLVVIGIFAFSIAVATCRP